jgi:pimeloyl-ACP methyl ester carboxylesterase
MRKLVAWQGGSPFLVDDLGSGSGLICLHGLGGGSYFFAGLSKSLINSRRVLSFDLPGTGFNLDTVEAFSIDACVDATVEMIDQVSPEPVALLGHSMGAIVALKAYAKRQEKVNGLIFVGGLPEAIPSIKKKLIQRIEQIGELGMSGIGEKVMPAIFAEETLSARRQLVAMYQRMLEMNTEESYIQSVRALVDASAYEDIESISVPCLVITGMEDLYASPFDVKAFADTIPSQVSTEIFEGCGHMIFYEDPTRFNESVDAFLQSLDNVWEFTYGDDN